jgi:hypothetical protein
MRSWNLQSEHVQMAKHRVPSHSKIFATTRSVMLGHEGPHQKCRTPAQLEGFHAGFHYMFRSFISHTCQMRCSPPKPFIWKSPRSLSCTPFTCRTLLSQELTVRSDATICPPCAMLVTRAAWLHRVPWYWARPVRASGTMAVKQPSANDPEERPQWILGPRNTRSFPSQTSLCTHAIGSLRRSSSQ